MAYELRDGQGSLFKNTRKEKETHPNLTGKIMLDGKLYWLSAWRKPGKNGGADWLSLSATPVEGGGRQPGEDDGW